MSEAQALLTLSPASTWWKPLSSSFLHIPLYLLLPPSNYCQHSSHGDLANTESDRDGLLVNTPQCSSVHSVLPHGGLHSPLASLIHSAPDINLPPAHHACPHFGSSLQLSPPSRHCLTNSFIPFKSAQAAPSQQSHPDTIHLANTPSGSLSSLLAFLFPQHLQPSYLLCI